MNDFDDYDEYNYCYGCEEDDYWECYCCPFNPVNVDNPEYDPWDI